MMAREPAAIDIKAWIGENPIRIYTATYGEAVVLSLPDDETWTAGKTEALIKVLERARQQLLKQDEYLKQEE